jgi:hypothetical protein
MTVPTYAFITLQDSATASAEIFDDRLVCVVGSDWGQVCTALTDAGLTDWCDDGKDEMTFTRFDDDYLEDYFGASNAYFEENSADDFATPWHFASDASDGTGSSAYAGAYTIEGLVEYFATGILPLGV